MTNRDFIVIATALSRSRPGRHEEAARRQWENDFAAMAAVCQDSNPRFNYSKFVEDACYDE